MFRNKLDWFWHSRLGRPYQLHVSLDQGTGQPVVALHGLAASGQTWSHLAGALQNQPYQLIAPDLLGFGKSPKPVWLRYDVDDHARAVIAVIKRRRRRRQPAILVAHSMGCLIAARVARLRPDLVDRLILYQMPLYAGLPTGKRYSLRRDIYLGLYQRIIDWPPRTARTRLRQGIKRLTGLNVTTESWQPFVRSLQYTIMEQTTLQDLRNLKQPIDIIYGSLDMVVIRGRPTAVFERVPAPLQTHTIVQLHAVSLRASKFIAKRIVTKS